MKELKLVKSSEKPLEELKAFWEELGSKDLRNDYTVNKQSFKKFDEERKSIWRRFYDIDYRVVEKHKIERLIMPSGRTRFKKVVVWEKIHSPVEFYIEEVLCKGCLNDEIKYWYNEENEVIKLWKVILNRINFCCKSPEYKEDLLKLCEWEVK